jgi:hypothetical protein
MIFSSSIFIHRCVRWIPLLFVVKGKSMKENRTNFKETSNKFHRLILCHLYCFICCDMIRREYMDIDLTLYLINDDESFYDVYC